MRRVDDRQRPAWPVGRPRAVEEPANDYRWPASQAAEMRCSFRWVQTECRGTLAADSLIG